MLDLNFIRCLQRDLLDLKDSLKGEDDEQYSWDQSEAQTKDYYTDSFIIKLHVSLILKPPGKKFHCKIKEPTRHYYKPQVCNLEKLHRW